MINKIIKATGIPSRFFNFGDEKYIDNIEDAGYDPVRKVYYGSAICIVCNKKMPICWEAVCTGCGGTLCYDHAYIKPPNKWYCKSCITEGGM